MIHLKNLAIGLGSILAIALTSTIYEKEIKNLDFALGDYLTSPVDMCKSSIFHRKKVLDELSRRLMIFDGNIDSYIAMKSIGQMGLKYLFFANIGHQGLILTYTPENGMTQRKISQHEEKDVEKMLITSSNSTLRVLNGERIFHGQCHFYRYHHDDNNYEFVGSNISSSEERKIIDNFNKIIQNEEIYAQSLPVSFPDISEVSPQEITSLIENSIGDYFPELKKVTSH